MRKTTLIRVLLIAGPFLAIVLLAHFLQPVLRDRAVRSDLAAVGDFERIDLPGVQVYHAGSVDPVLAADLGEYLRAFCGLLVEEWGRDFGLGRSSGGLVLQVFESVQQLDIYHQSRFREEFHNLGGFYDAAGRLVAIPVPMDPIAPLATLFHEGTHLVFDLASSGGIGRYPIWVNEGLATFFEGSRSAPDGSIRLGGKDMRAFALAKAALDSGRIASFDAMVQSGPAQFRGERNADYYAAAHTLAAYLLLGEEGRFRTGFGRYVRELKTGGRSSPGLIYFKLDENRDALDEGWRRFISRSLEERS